MMTQSINMSTRKTIDLITPTTGLKPVINDYCVWGGFSFFCFFIADAYDHLEPAAYAAYYSEAAQQAINPRFWVLLSAVSLTLLCLALPITYLAHATARLAHSADLLRLAVRQFFTAAFTVGSLITGLMIAQWLHGHENAHAIADRWPGSNEASFTSIAALIFCNALLGLLSESICHRTDRKYSGVIKLLIDAPPHLALPAYIAVAALTALIITGQQ